MVVDSWADNYSIQHTNNGIHNICQDNREHKMVQKSTEDTFGLLWQGAGKEGPGTGGGTVRFLNFLFS